MKVVIEITNEGVTTRTSGEGAVGEATVGTLAQIFGDCLFIANRKAQTYGDAWRSEGYMGNVARVLSKVSRLRNMLWRDFGISDSDESVDDTLLDLVNLAAFAWHNYRERNKWGDNHA